VSGSGTVYRRNTGNAAIQLAAVFSGSGDTYQRFSGSASIQLVTEVNGSGTTYQQLSGVVSAPVYPSVDMRSIYGNDARLFDAVYTYSKPAQVFVRT
jgi:hypothetical protein